MTAGWFSRLFSSQMAVGSTEAETIERLQSLVFFTGGGELPSRDEMLATIEEAERRFAGQISAELADALAGAWYCFESWYARGPDRKQYLERAADYYRRSGNKAMLGKMLIDEAQIRDLDEGLPLLEGIYNSTKTYEPILCSLVEGFYKHGQYARAAAVALELHERATNDPEWSGSAVPPAPMCLAAKAFRAEANRLKKAGQYPEALEVMRELIATGESSERDRKRFERLKADA